MEANGERKGVFQKSWYEYRMIVVLFSMFLFPVGMYGLWKSSRFKKWKELKRIGQFWRLLWTFWVFAFCVTLYVSPKEPIPNNSVQNIPAISPLPPPVQKVAVQKQEPLLKATVNWLPDDMSSGMKYINGMMVKHHGTLEVHLNKARMRKGEIIYSLHDDEVAMIGASYSCNDGNNYYNNDHGTSERLTLKDVDYVEKRAVFEFVAMLQTNLRDKGKSVKTQFTVEGEHFDSAVKAGIIAPEGS